MIATAPRWRLLTVFLATFAASGLISTTAFAQDYTTNTIEGVVQDINGRVIPNASVTATSDRGVRRTTTSDADGEFRMPQMPIGPYSVEVAAQGYAGLAELPLYNQLGATGDFVVTMMPEGAAIEEIITTGVRQSSIDFESNTSGISVNVEELQLKFPVGRSATDIALFAPGTHAGDTDFNSRSNGNLASFSGGSVAENAYYINGMNVTNFRTFEGGSEIPFEFFEQVEVKTGGYQAEFGRSMGGFINSVSKSGSNDFKFEATGYWTPESGRGERKDVENTWNSLDYDKDTQLIMQMSGPIIEDRIFFYGLYNDRDIFEEDYSNARYIETRDDEPFYAAKIDIVPFDGHRLEYTYFSDERNIRQRSFAFNDAGLDRSEVDGSEIGLLVGENITQAGGENHIVKYTAVINDNFSLSATYGENDFGRSAGSTKANNPVIYERMTNQSSSTIIGDWVNTYETSAADSREAVRVDADFYFDLAGDHHVRVGWDQEDLLSDNLSSLSGGEYWRYEYCSEAGGCNPGSGPTTVPLGTEWVRHIILDSGGSFEVKQNAWYIQDSWQINDRLTLNAGIRSETFENYNSLGEVFIETDEEIAPRLGVTYDLFGDGQTLLSGFFGRYYMPIASNTNIRAAGSELFIIEYLNYDGYDQRNGDDTPTGVDFANPIFKTIASDGTIADPLTVRAEQVDPLFNDEYILGIEHQFDNGWVVGGRFVYRELSTQIDDIGVNPAVVAWALENGYQAEDVWEWLDPGQHDITYVLANPGEDLTYLTDMLCPDNTLNHADPACPDGLVEVDLTAEQLGYPKPNREYTSIELTAEKDFDNWGVSVNYVWSENEGNTEGLVKSDNGQADPGLTQDFDLAALTLNASGPLPTEVAHYLKAGGYYVINDQLRVGGTLRIRSPRQFGCFGQLPDGIYGQADQAFAGGDFGGDFDALRQLYEQRYGGDYWFCDGEASPRGSQDESDWNTELNASVTWTPDFDNLVGRLTFRLDVFNLFNERSVTDLFEGGEDDSGTDLDTFGKASAYQTPRRVRLSANWAFE